MAEKKLEVFSALNLAVILITIAFFISLIGDFSEINETNSKSITTAMINIEDSCGFLCRLGQVITGEIKVPEEINVSEQKPN